MHVAFASLCYLMVDMEKALSGCYTYNVCTLYYALRWVMKPPPATHTPTPTLLFPFLIWCNAGFLTWRRYIPCIWAQLNKEPHGPEWRWATSNVTGGSCGRETRNVGSWVHLERSETCLGERRKAQEAGHFQKWVKVWLTWFFSGVLCQTAHI